MFLLKKSSRRLPLLPKMKSNSGSHPLFHKFLTPDPGPQKGRILLEMTPAPGSTATFGQRWPWIQCHVEYLSCEISHFTPEMSEL